LLLVVNKLLHCVTFSVKFRCPIYEKLEVDRGWFAEDDALGRSGVAHSPDFQPVQCCHQVTVVFALKLGVNNWVQRLDFNFLRGLPWS